MDNIVAQLLQSSFVVVDIETKDPNLIEKGPGACRNDGYICGVGVGAEIEGKFVGEYYPIKHPDTTTDEREKNTKILKALLAVKNKKLGTNIAYDLEWLLASGFGVNYTALHDIQYVEPLLDEYARSYSLENLAKKYGVGEKKIDLIGEYCSSHNFKGEPRQHIWKMPSTVVAPYVMGDLHLPIEIFKKQRIELERQKLYDLYRMETKLIPVLLKMRKNGVRIDLAKLKSTAMRVTEQAFLLKNEIFEWAGKEFNIGSSSQLAAILDKKGIVYPRREPTELMKQNGKEGNPKLDKAALIKMQAHDDIFSTILKYRHYETLINMFLHPYLEFQHEGRLFGTFHPLKSDDYGTVAGRFSASKPNLQQVSAIDEAAGDEEDALKGKILRELFIPEEGKTWAKLDYSQIEYRIMAHYAKGAAAEALRHKYNTDPDTDMHQVIVEAANVERRTAKRLNFGGAYGMGIETAANKFGWTMLEAEKFMNSYHTAAPYVKLTRNAVSSTAQRRGYIFTLLGRKARTHPSRKLHSMFNRLIQGTAADIMKKAMVDADEKGLFEILDLHLTVHDELDVSFDPNKKIDVEALQELKETMEKTVSLSVPIKVDCHTGRNWAEAD